jgi:hypothetical protein
MLENTKGLDVSGKQVKVWFRLVNDVWFGLVWFIVFNATFNNISVIKWQSVLLVEETRVPGENN